MAVTGRISSSARATNNRRCLSKRVAGALLPDVRLHPGCAARVGGDAERIGAAACCRTEEWADDGRSEPICSLRAAALATGLGRSREAVISEVCHVRWGRAGEKVFTHRREEIDHL
jgi:hypothetical protein